MTVIRGLIFVLTLVATGVLALEPFRSDGCSMFPDGNLITQKDWCQCCLQHDIAYWQGGTAEQRLQADRELRACILTKTQDRFLANVMYEGVRFGGSPYFYNWYRWGYGWPYARKYQQLSDEEERLVLELLARYQAEDHPQVCQPP